MRQSIWGFCVHVGAAPREASAAYIPQTQHCLVATGILVVTGAVASSIDNLGVVFGVLGSIGGAVMFYMFPALCFLRLLRRGHGTENPVVPERHYTKFLLLASLLFLYGVLVCVAGTTAIFL